MLKSPVVELKGCQDRSARAPRRGSRASAKVGAGAATAARGSRPAAAAPPPRAKAR